MFSHRGLTPRLAMYISQGAIFFTSYEFLKTIMFPEQEGPASSFGSWNERTWCSSAGSKELVLICQSPELTSGVVWLRVYL
jgi:hypothetical protein